jgi:hypothetical protein
MRYAVALVLSLLLQLTTVGTALACEPLPPRPLAPSLEGTTALAYGQVTTEYTSGRVILSVKSYAGPGPAPEHLFLQWTTYQVNPNCSRGARWSLLGTEVVVVLKGTPPALSEPAVGLADKLYVDNQGQLGTVGNERVDDLLRRFAADHGLTVQNRSIPSPDRAPVSDGPPWESAPAPPVAEEKTTDPPRPASPAPRGLWFLAGAGALLLTVTADAYRRRRHRLQNAR